MKGFFFLFIYLFVHSKCKELHVPFCSKWHSNPMTIIGPNFGMNKPTALVIDRQNDTLYVVDSGNNRILKHYNNSNITERVRFNKLSIDDKLLHPEDLVLDSSGAMYISDTGNNRTVKWSFEPDKSEIILNIQSPQGIDLVEEDKYLYIVKKDQYPTVIRFDLTRKQQRKVAGDYNRNVFGYSLENLYNPIGIYVDRNKNIYIAESLAARISKWSPNALEGTRVAGNTGDSISSPIAALGAPSSIFVDDQNSMYITDVSKNQIFRWQNGASEPECLVGCTLIVNINETIHANKIIKPYDIAFDSKFNLYVLDSANNQVKKFPIYYNFTCSLAYCKPPILSLIPHLPIYIRSQTISIEIEAILDCYIWLTIFTSCKTQACYPGDYQCKETIKLNNLVNSFINWNSSKLIISPFSLPVGIYHFNCTVRMTQTYFSSWLTTTIEIVRSPVIISLLPIGKSEIMIGQEQNYTFYPNVTLKIEDQSYLDNMRFVYYCRKYPNTTYSKKNIDDDIKKPTTSTCFDRFPKSKSFIYDDENIRSSLTILQNSLQTDQIYEFYVEMYNSNGLVDKSDTILVQIVSNDVFDLRITSLFDFLIPDNDYSLFNPSSQLVLRSSCLNCELQSDIIWKIYQGQNNSQSIPQWKLYIFPKEMINVWFYGVNTSLLTVTSDFFLSNKSIDYWRFEAIYSNDIQTFSTAVQLKTNHPPLESQCSVDTTNGTIISLFTFNCQTWEDLDGIRDYFLHAVIEKNQVRMSITYSKNPIFSTYLPAGDRKLNYQLKLIIHVRDKLGAWTESNVIEVIVRPKPEYINAIMNFSLNNSNVLLKTNDHAVINLFSILLNQIGSEEQETIMKNGQIKISDYIISDFETERIESSINNQSNASIKFLQNQNHRSIVRQYLLNQFQNISLPTTIEELILISSTINQLTETTCEWTQKSITLTTNICEQYANIIYSLSREITFEQIILVANALSPCPSNIFTGLAAPLQKRGIIFSDEFIADDFNFNENIDDQLVDYDQFDTSFCNLTTKKFVQCKEIFIDENNSTEEILLPNRYYYHQKMLASQLINRIDLITFYLAKGVRRHLNLFQKVSVAYPTLRMLVEQILPDALRNKFIDFQTRNASIYLPTNLTIVQSNQIGIRSTLLLLPAADGIVNVSLSTALTFDIIDDNDEQLKINTTNNNSLIEMFIPRDINLYRPDFSRKNMTTVYVPKTGKFKFNRQFFIYYIDLVNNTPSTPISIHFELKPEQLNISYSLIYKFIHVPAWNLTHKIIDGSAMFCSQNLVNENDYYRFYLDNEKTTGFNSLYLGIRQVNDDEACLNTLPYLTNQPYGFSHDFSIRIYTSGCYFLDEKQRWNSFGLKVGPETNLDYTHCYSNHT